MKFSSHLLGGHGGQVEAISRGQVVVVVTTTAVTSAIGASAATSATSTATASVVGCNARNGRKRHQSVGFIKCHNMNVNQEQTQQKSHCKTQTDTYTGRHLNLCQPGSPGGPLRGSLRPRLQQASKHSLYINWGKVQVQSTQY